MFIDKRKSIWTICNRWQVNHTLLLHTYIHTCTMACIWVKRKYIIWILRCKPSVTDVYMVRYIEADPPSPSKLFVIYCFGKLDKFIVKYTVMIPFSTRVNPLESASCKFYSRITFTRQSETQRRCNIIEFSKTEEGNTWLWTDSIRCIIMLKRLKWLMLKLCKIQTADTQMLKQWTMLLEKSIYYLIHEFCDEVFLQALL